MKKAREILVFCALTFVILCTIAKNKEFLTREWFFGVDAPQNFIDLSFSVAFAFAIIVLVRKTMKWLTFQKRNNIRKEYISLRVRVLSLKIQYPQKRRDICELRDKTRDNNWHVLKEINLKNILDLINCIDDLLDGVHVFSIDALKNSYIDLLVACRQLEAAYCTLEDVLLYERRLSLYPDENISQQKWGSTIIKEGEGYTII